MAELKSLIVNGVSRLNSTAYAKNVYADKIIINSGTSSQFLKADGSLDSTAYSPTSHTHSYLPLSGGTLTGTLTIASTSSGNYNEGLRITTASNSWAGITFGSTGTSGAPTNGWFVARNPNNKFIISPADSSDTTGLTLNSGGNALWRNNILIHAGNYTSYVNTTNFPGLNKTGTVTQVKVGTTAYDPSSGVISLPAYPTTLPASDVYAWAKASTKPSYTLDEVSDGSTRKLVNYVPKQDNARFYPFIGSSNSSSYYKVTLPYANITFTSTRWMMVSMELVLGGTYSNGANGKIFLSYYLTVNSNNVWTASDVRAIAIGCKLTDNSVWIKYDITNPGIFYVHTNNNIYNSFSIKNLTANDSAPSYDFRNTTIQAIAVGDIPTTADKVVSIVCIETKTGSDVYVNNNTLWHAGNDGSGSGLDADLLDGNHASAFATSGHTHDGRYLRWAGSSADVTAMTWGTLTSANGYTILSHAASSDGGDWGMVYKSGKIFAQLDGYYYQNEGAYRVTDVSETVTALGTSGNYLTWTKNGSTNNITVPYATTAGSAPASDVYAWAKASTKPSYTLDEVSDGSSRKLANYLPLAGGTMTGHINLNTNAIYFGASGKKAILSYSSTYPNYGIWYNDDSTDQMMFSASNNANDPATADLCINGGGDGVVTIRGNKVWHAGNDGSGTGLDADLLDGNHASAFATSGHNHDSTYLKLAGGTMTGAAPITFTENKVCLNFRNNSSYYSKVEYMTSGNEALVFGNTAAVTSFIFANGLNLTDRSDYQNLGIVAMQIKSNKVSINRTVRPDSDPQTETLYIGGTTRVASNDFYVGTASGSQCHQQYDYTTKCLKFVFD